MYSPRFALGIFDRSDAGPGLVQHQHWSRISIDILLEALVLINLNYLRATSGVPELYKSGVRYAIVVPQGQKDDDWQDIPTTLQLGYGDCEDLACWRAAELRFRGIAAIASGEWRAVNEHNFFHVVVILPDGRREDPSRMLGMR